MALADWTGLTASIGSWMHRADFTSIAPDLITMAEQDFNDELRVREMEVATSLTITSGYLAHPSDWLEWKNINVTVSSVTYPVRPLNEELIAEKTAGETNNPPRYYVVRGGKTYIQPNDSSSYSFPVVYYGTLPALSASQTTNWLLTRYPSLYLYGSLTHAKAFLDEVTWQFFEGKRKDLVERIKVATTRASFGGQVLEMKPDTWAP